MMRWALIHPWNGTTRSVLSSRGVNVEFGLDHVDSSLPTGGGGVMPGAEEGYPVESRMRITEVIHVREG